MISHYFIRKTKVLQGHQQYQFITEMTVVNTGGVSTKYLFTCPSRPPSTYKSVFLMTDFYMIYLDLETTLMNKNYISEEIKSRLNVGNACCHSVLELLPLSDLDT
jgi:hypothetical protein